MSLYLQRIVTATPPRSLSREDTPDVLRNVCINRRSTKLMERIARLTRIDRRYLSILDHQSTVEDNGGIYRPPSVQPSGPGMGARTELFDVASDALLRRMLPELPAAQLEATGTLITVSCTHASSPGLEQPIFACTPIRHDVDRFHLGFMGCSAGLSALRLLHRMRADTHPALVVACELSSLHFQYTDELDQMTANLLFADGAAAALVSPQRGPVRMVDFACSGLPEYADQMKWFAGDHGLQLRLSQALPDTLAEHIRPAVQAFLARHDLDIDEVGHWCVHPGGPQILSSVEAALGLPDSALDLSRAVLQRFGNMSSPTTLFILEALLEQRPDGPAVAIAFGPGLTIELALLDLNFSAY